MTTPQPTPVFTNPPVVEVALSVQFDTLGGFRVAHLGSLWAKFRERFPQTLEQPPLRPFFEGFGAQPTLGTEASFEIVVGPPVPRCWFLNEKGTELIQIQQDRFIHNWRKVEEGNKYPRFGSIRDVFKKDFAAFEAFVQDEKIGTVAPNQCEVTYVNHIPAGEGWKEHSELDRVLTTWRPEFSDSFLPRPEQARFGCQFLIPGSKGPAGRLHVEVAPAFTTGEPKPIIVMKLTARGRPAQGPGGVAEFLELGHEWIVRGFASITTKGMHKVWGRTA